jgi:hypothetical protein
MTMGPSLRKLALTAHVTASVGWLGAVAAYLALALVGWSSEDLLRVRAAYLAMDMVGWYVIVPASLASLTSGIVQALGTPWGLLRHYWVLIKLLITALCTALLLVHMQPTTELAELAAQSALSSAEAREVRFQLVGDAGAALVALLVTTTLSVFKPRGVTRYGRRKASEPRPAPQP